MRLLLLNLRCDKDFAPLAFACDWIEEIALRAESVTVITNYWGAYEAPENVTVLSLGGEANVARLLRLWRLYRYTWIALRQTRVDICFGHMTPMFAGLIAPLCRLMGRPVVLWYAHGHVPVVLRLAAPIVSVCVTSSKDGFQLQASNLKILSQGISIGRVLGTGGIATQNGEFRIVNIGRLSRLKRIELSICAMAILKTTDPGCVLEIVGDPLGDKEFDYVSELRELVNKLDLHDCVSIVPAVPFERIGEVFARAKAAINCAPLHSIDKAALEEMASGLPCVVTNPAFHDALGDAIAPLLVESGEPQALATVLSTLARMPNVERIELGRRLSEIVKNRHSLQALVGRLFVVFQDVISVS